MQLKTKERSYKAGVGMPAQKFVLKGNPGEDKTVVVPLGTICETETGMIIGLLIIIIKFIQDMYITIVCKCNMRTKFLNLT